jgi:DDE_Tnp_1-associated
MAKRPDGSLYDLFTRFPDPRDPRGRIYSLASLLTLTVTAMLCGCRSLYAIAQWGRSRRFGPYGFRGLGGEVPGGPDPTEHAAEFARTWVRGQAGDGLEVDVDEIVKPVEF